MDLITRGLPELQPFAFAVVAGIVIRTTLVLAGQRWAKTYSSTVTYLLLPSVLSPSCCHSNSTRGHIHMSKFTLETLVRREAPTVSNPDPHFADLPKPAARSLVRLYKSPCHLQLSSPEVLTRCLRDREMMLA